MTVGEYLAGKWSYQWQRCSKSVTDLNYLLVNTSNQNSIVGINFFYFIFCYLLVYNFKLIKTNLFYIIFKATKFKFKCNQSY